VRAIEGDSELAENGLELIGLTAGVVESEGVRTFGDRRSVADMTE